MGEAKLCPTCKRLPSESAFCPQHDLGKTCVVRHCFDPVHRIADAMAFEVPYQLERLKDLEPFPVWGFGGGSQMEMAAQDRWYVRNGHRLTNFLSVIREAHDAALTRAREGEKHG